MGWPENEAERKLHEALLVLDDTCGENTTTRLLETELTRRHVSREYRRTHQLLAEADKQNAELRKRIDEAVAVLEFYADEDNYEARSNKPPQITKDKGQRARLALATIGPDENGEEDEQ